MIIKVYKLLSGSLLVFNSGFIKFFSFEFIKPRPENNAT